MKKKILSILFTILSVFLITSCELTSNTSLSTPDGVKVSKKGLVEWNEVTNATEYDVELKHNDEILTTTVKECSYQIENPDNDYEITVTAKHNNAKSNKSESITYVGRISRDKTNIYEDFVNKTIGEKNPELTENESKNYDEIASFLESSSLTAAEENYSRVNANKIINSFEEAGSDSEQLLSAAIMAITMYSSKDVEAAIYFEEVKLLANLIGMRQAKEAELKALMSQDQPAATANQDVVSNPELVQLQAEIDLYNLLFETINNEGTSVAKHATNMIQTINGTYKSLGPTFIPSVKEIIEDAMNGELNAKRIYNVKNLLVKALRNNMIESEDLRYFYDLLGNTASELVTLLFNYVNSSDLPEEVKVILNNLKEMIGEVQFADFDELYTSFKTFYLGILEDIENISLEYITNVCECESPTEMVLYNVVYVLQKNLTVQEKVSVEEITNVVTTIDSLVTQVLGEGVNLEVLTGLTNEELINLLKAVLDLGVGAENSLVEILKNPELYHQVKALLNVNIEENKSSGTTVGNINDDKLLQYVMNKLNITELEENKKYEVYEQSDVSDTTRCTYKSIVINTHSFMYDSQGINLIYVEYDYEERVIVVENADDLKPIINYLVILVKNNNEEITNLISVLLPLLSKLNLEGLVDQEVINVIALIANATPENVNALLIQLVDVIERLYAFVEDKNLNQLIFTILNGDVDEIKTALAGFGTEDNIVALHTTVEKLAVVLDELQLLPTLGFETSEEFVTSVNGIIDSFFVTEA
ncbi:MAG: fibronectin type III domain-containing protein [Bacilli bacterium]|nr:fibronectin type III domain-containing protein [Bacilli bacterium]